MQGLLGEVSSLMLWGSFSGCMSLSCSSVTLLNSFLIRSSLGCVSLICFRVLYLKKGEVVVAIAEHHESSEIRTLLRFKRSLHGLKN